MSRRTDEGLAGLQRGGQEGIAAALAAFAADSAAGEADADCWLALMAAAGVGMPQSWETALDHLEHAASRGSASAIGQLAALAGEAVPAGSADVRAAINPAALLARPAKRVINAQPRTVGIEAFLSNGMAAWLIGRARSGLQRAQVFQGAAGAQDGGRTNSSCMFRFVDCDVVILMTRTMIANAISVPAGALEIPQVLHYEVGEQFAAHFDWLDPADVGQAQEIAKAGQRIATFLIYLNDDFDGGETAFPELEIAHRGRVGDALYFANVQADGTPDRRTLHTGLAPTRGEKWIFSQWVRNRARI